MKKNIKLKLTEIEVSDYKKKLTFEIPEDVNLEELDGIFDFYEKEVSVQLKII